MQIREQVRSSTLQELEAEAQFEVKKLEVETQSKRMKVEAQAETDVAELLGAAYAPLQTDLEELGVESVDDLEELEADDIERLAAKLKKIQAKKFTKTIAALRA